MPVIKDVTNVIFAKRALITQVTLQFIEGFTLEKNLMSVKYVKRDFLDQVI